VIAIDKIWHNIIKLYFIYFESQEIGINKKIYRISNNFDIFFCELLTIKSLKIIGKENYFVKYMSCFVLFTQKTVYSLQL